MFRTRGQHGRLMKEERKKENRKLLRGLLPPRGQCERKRVEWTEPAARQLSAHATSEAPS